MARDLADAAMIMGVVLAGSLFGIMTRPVGFLAAFWPVNAMLLGLLVRRPDLSTFHGWTGAFLGFVIADTITGSTLVVTLWLTAANMAGVGTGFLLYRRLSAEHRHLQRTLSVLYLFAVSFLAAVVAALVGGGAGHLLFDRNVLTGLAFWFTTEFVNYIVILPVILTFQSWREVLGTIRQFAGLGRPLIACAPVPLLVLSTAGAIIVGGPGALTFPVPALLWCALSFSLFGTAVLTLIVSTTLMVAASAGMMHAQEELNIIDATMSFRFGIALLALGPLTVASINSVRNELIRNLNRAANYDYLTNALARGAFMKRSDDLLAATAQRPSGLAILMLDVDHFKKINDRHGHFTGDRVLAGFASTVAAVLRENDLFGRLGGEEFAVLLPGVTREDALSIAERLRDEVEKLRIASDSGEIIGITVSVGLIHTEQPCRHAFDALLTATDRNLYEAKQGGRNRVVSAGR